MLVANFYAMHGTDGHGFHFLLDRTSTVFRNQRHSVFPLVAVALYKNSITRSNCPPKLGHSYT
jgi:hypothetical protein